MISPVVAPSDALCARPAGGTQHHRNGKKRAVCVLRPFTSPPVRSVLHPYTFISLARTIQPRLNLAGLCAFCWQSCKKDSTEQPATASHRMRKIPSAQDKPVQSSQAPPRSVPFCFCCPVQLPHSKNRKVKSNLTRYYIYISIYNVPMYHYF